MNINISNSNQYHSIPFVKHYDNYKIILIRRKDTIGYVEFLRGKYNVNNDKYILKLMNLMTVEEKERILQVMNFDKLRDILGMNKKHNL